MPETPQPRRATDRRRQPRGGRRADDHGGFAPLVLVIGDPPAVVERAETILAALKFAVATGSGVDEALHVLPVLRPDLVVAGASDAARLRSEAPEHLPVVVMQDGMEERPEALIEEIRQALRSKS